ncbi:MAG: hypothetical protein O3B68_02600 [Planctomycetota bacterium]|nr:hypothetical protein [Planctomycetota bacterium]
MKEEKMALRWIRLLMATVPLTMVGVFAVSSARAEQVPEKATDSPVAISLHQGHDDLDAPFLRKRVHIHIEKRMLADFAAQLSEQIAVPVLLDRKAIADAGLLVSEPLTFSTEQPGTQQRVAELNSARTPIEAWDANLVMRLDQVLDLTLRDFELTWFVKDGILHLTTIEATRWKHPILRSYTLTPFRNQGINDKTLMFALRLEPGILFGRWSCDLVTVGHILTIRSSFPSHRKLQSLLQAIANPAHEQSGNYAAEEAACRQQLDRIVDADFLDTPLRDAIDGLAYQSKGRIFLDKVAVEESGGSIDKPVTFALKGKSLQETFDLFLAELKLTMTVKAGELFVTTPDVAREMRTSRVYDLRSVATTKELRDSLVQALMSLTSEQWEDTDKGGDMAMLDNGVLIAVTNLATHEEISKLVDFYRHHLARRTQ